MFDDPREWAARAVLMCIEALETHFEPDGDRLNKRDHERKDALQDIDTLIRNHYEKIEEPEDLVSEDDFRTLRALLADHRSSLWASDLDGEELAASRQLNKDAGEILRRLGVRRR